MKTSFENFVDNTRIIRNDLLLKSDWTQVADVALTAGEKTLWATYRQTLRDLPATLTEEGMATFNFPNDPAGKGWERPSR